jgi:hypothetical protein
MSILTLEEPIILKAVVADTNFDAGGGWRVSVSPYNFLYTKLKENPKIFVGMVFRAKEKDKEDTYVRIINGVHRWVPSPKRGELPFLECLAVRFENIGTDLLRAVELIEEHRQKTEGDFKV